jgi:hypothetical protein
MLPPDPLNPESLEYQLTILHCRQDGFLPPAHRALQHKYRPLGIEIVNIVENTYTGILTVVLGESPVSWTAELAEAISREASESAAVLKCPSIRFGSFSSVGNAG